MKSKGIKKMCLLAGAIVMSTVAQAFYYDATVTIDRALNSPTLTIRYSGATVALVELRVNGVSVEISGDDLIVHGRGHAAGGGTVVTHMDHRIAMSALVMGLASERPVRADDTAFIATSFPTFAPMMRGLGANLS